MNEEAREAAMEVARMEFRRIRRRVTSGRMILLCDVDSITSAALDAYEAESDPSHYGGSGYGQSQGGYGHESQDAYDEGLR